MPPSGREVARHSRDGRSPRLQGLQLCNAFLYELSPSRASRGSPLSGGAMKRPPRRAGAGGRFKRRFFEDGKSLFLLQWKWREASSLWGMPFRSNRKASARRLEAVQPPIFRERKITLSASMEMAQSVLALGEAISIITPQPKKSTKTLPPPSLSPLSAPEKAFDSLSHGPLAFFPTLCYNDSCGQTEYPCRAGGSPPRHNPHHIAPAPIVKWI